MKPLLFTISLLALSSSTLQSNVYICVSPTAKKYHYSKTCRGLQKCTHTIKSVTLSEATKAGYESCLIEK